MGRTTNRKVLSMRAQGSLDFLLPKLGPIAAHNAAPPGTIDLATAENRLITGEVREICREAIQNRYENQDLAADSSLSGNASLRESLASFFNEYFEPAMPVSADHIALGAGAGNCLDSLVHSICDAGDSLIIPSPYWFGFEPYLKCHPDVNIIATNATYHTIGSPNLVDSIKKAYLQVTAKEHVRAVLLCNPQNPLSQCYSSADLTACLAFCQEHALHFISDEIYALTLIGTGNSTIPAFRSALSLGSVVGSNTTPPQIHVIWSPSKLLGYSGLRIGCIVSQGSPEVTLAVSLANYGLTSTLSHLCMKALLSSSKLPCLLTLNSQRLGFSYEALRAFLWRNDLPLIPASHGLFAFAQIGKLNAKTQAKCDVFEELKSNGVLVSPGRFYDKSLEAQGWARITLSVPLVQMEEALRIMERVLVQNRELQMRETDIPGDAG